MLYAQKIVWLSDIVVVERCWEQTFSWGLWLQVLTGTGKVEFLFLVVSVGVLGERRMLFGGRWSWGVGRKLNRW